MELVVGNSKLTTLKNSVMGQISALFFIEMSSAAAFAFFFSGLSLFLTQKEMYSKESAAVITGLFLSLNYFLQLVGGIVVNRIISYKNFYSFGSIVSILGCLLLASNMGLKLGFALFLMSSFVTNVCLRMFITRLFNEDQVAERRIAFIWNYVGMNIGFLVGGFLSGYYSILDNYSHLFVIMSVLIATSFLLTVTFIKNHKSDHVKRSNLFQFGTTGLIIMGLILIMVTLFNYAAIVANYIIIVSVVMSGLLIYYGFKKSGSHDKVKFLKFVFYSLLAICFWTIYMLTPTAFMQLIDNDVQTQIFGFKIAPQWFFNIDTIIILILAPLFAFLLKKRNDTHKNSLDSFEYFNLAFIFITAAFIILLVGLYTLNDQNKLPAWSVLGYLSLLTIGEIFISPIGNSLIGELIPETMKGLMTGLWSVNIGIGSLLASMIANKFILPYVNKNGLSGVNLIQFQNTTFLVSSVLAVFTLSLLIYRNSLILNQKMLKLT